MHRPLRSTSSVLPGLALLFSAVPTAAQIIDNPISFHFSGTVQPYSATFTNPYSGEVVTYSSDMANVNNTTYFGATNFDAIFYTSLDDVLLIRDENDQQTASIEVHFLGDGDDVLILADEEFAAASTGDLANSNNLTIQGANGNDILWGNAGDDVILGEGDNDHVVGGPGNDRLRGGIGDDYIGGGSGDDILDGGEGSDLLVGGPGSDVYETYFVGSATIVEPSSDEINFIHLSRLGPGSEVFSLEAILFEETGRDLVVTYPGLGSVTIIDQLASATAGIDFIVADNGEGESLDLRALFPVPEPTGLLAIVAAVLPVTMRRGERRGGVLAGAVRG